ncbi:MAG: S41 family peptidase [Candidatus Tectomicrobia bacterium]|nr:S41 family peptidase [Candidatus Tectomicrobia bacterium]
MRRWADKRLTLALLVLLAALWAGLPGGAARPDWTAVHRPAWGSEDLSFRVVQEAFSIIRKNHYTEPDIRKLILGSLEGMRDKVASDLGKDKVRLIEEKEGIRWGAGQKEIRIPADEDLDGDLLPLMEAYDLVRAYYPEEKQKQARQLAYAAIAGMMRRLDPHSALMTPEAFKELQVETRGEFGGIGIEITLRDGKLTVVSPIEGTPAHRVGIQAGDLIVRIDGFDTQGITLMGAVRRMRGPKGTAVTLEVRRAGADGPVVFSIVRDIIHIQSVKEKVLPGKIGYVRVSSFVESTSRDLFKSLRSLERQGIRGLILDLRNNPGGLLRQAVEVADLFLGKDSLIVYTRGKRPEHNLKFVDRRPGPFGKFPMIVLVNAGSASASEIVTGALQDLHRALVMGTRTFGKGSVQTIIPLSDGSGLRVTTALYYTPKGREIQEKGIPPDAVVPQPGEENSRDVVLEKELVRSHQNGNGAKAPGPQATPERKPDPPKAKPPLRKPILLGSEEDHQLSIARRVLDEEPVAQVAQLMIRARQILASANKAQAKAGAQP